MRAFEAAARLGSFAGAADELSVTSGAVAQHIKSLEAWTGERLFKRHAQGIELTSLGASVLTDFIAAFDQLGVAVHNLRTNAVPREIRIAALPSVAQLWLSPRLPKMRTAMPEILISVEALETPPNMAREPYDLAIFFEKHPVSEHAIVICQDFILPVCSPAIAKRLQNPADLVNEVFLHDTTWSDDWKNWLSQASLGKNLEKSGPTFSLYSLAVEEAKNGAGVSIGHASLVSSQINSGTLVAPFDHSVGLEQSLTIEIAKPIIPDSFLQKLISWLSDS
ncbi:MAG: LysR family transcriptional regulator [bacterium]|nr:LysR family transcriptional regulator [bacterium]